VNITIPSESDQLALAKMLPIMAYGCDDAWLTHLHYTTTYSPFQNHVTYYTITW